MIKTVLLVFSVFLLGIISAELFFLRNIAIAPGSAKKVICVPVKAPSPTPTPTPIDKNEFYSREKKTPLISDEAIDHFKNAEIPWVESLKRGNGQSLVLTYQLDGLLTEAYTDILKGAFVITISDQAGAKLAHYKMKNNEKNLSNFLFYDGSLNKKMKFDGLKVGSKVHFIETWDVTKNPIVFTYQLIQL